MKKLLIVGLLALLVSGCKILDIIERVKPHIPKPEPEEVLPEPLPFVDGRIKWIHTDVSGWAETMTLRSINISRNHITYDYDKAGQLPVRTMNGVKVEANPWVIVTIGDTKYIATHEWMRPGQTMKTRRSVNGDHIGGALADWVPSPGERLGGFVSGLARSPTLQNVRERSGIVWYHWPALEGAPIQLCDETCVVCGRGQEKPPMMYFTWPEPSNTL